MRSRSCLILVAIMLLVNSTLSIASSAPQSKSTVAYPANGGFHEIEFAENTTYDLFAISNSEYIRVYNWGFEKLDANGTIHWNVSNSYDRYIGGGLLSNGTLVIGHCESQTITIGWYNLSGFQLNTIEQSTGDVGCTQGHRMIVMENGSITLGGTFIRTVSFGSNSLTSGHWTNFAYSTSGDCRNIYIAQYSNSTWDWAEKFAGSCSWQGNANLDFDDISESTNGSFLLTVNGKDVTHSSCGFSGSGLKSYTFFLDRDATCLEKFGPVYSADALHNEFTHHTVVYSNFTMVFWSNPLAGNPTVCKVEYLMSEADCSTHQVMRFRDVDKDSAGRIWVAGEYQTEIDLNGSILLPTGNSVNGFVGYFDNQTNWIWAISYGGVGGEAAHAIIATSTSTAILVGEYQPSATFGNQVITVGAGTQQFTSVVEHDTDGDSVLDSIDAFPTEPSQWRDLDGDGYGDNYFGVDRDDCPNTNGNSTIDSLGCSDRDGDGWSDGSDSFPSEPTQWSDSDGDGYGDNMAGNQPDFCPNQNGDSNLDYFGCSDIDFDGWSDMTDAFPSEPSQHEDQDSDGYGDTLLGFEGDSCPNEPGNSTLDRFGCTDGDGDGYSDGGDAKPLEPSQWADRDGDGFGDNDEGVDPDMYPLDATQWADYDEDGYGDNTFGNQGDSCLDEYGISFVDRFGCQDEDGDGVSDLNDAFPSDPVRWQDSDRDGVEDENDQFPFDPTQSADFDSDGFGDNPRGLNPDKFPIDPSQWSDVDGDGFGDNQSGNNSDAFITDPTQNSDADGDGFGDNPFGSGADAFPLDVTQWLDTDGDGLGDNQSGNNPDPYLNDADNDGYADSIDPLPFFASPGDLDFDGCSDEADLYPSDPSECKDFDGDGEADNADVDDDNDGWGDWDEIRVGTNPYDAADFPIEAFQLIIPGTTIGLDGWDLIGIFGGGPIFLWLLFGFVTRNSRADRFETQLMAARSKKELEEIALSSEYALMIRLLGAHQGIRLERLRAELDDAIEQGLPLPGEENEENMSGEPDTSDVPSSPPAAIIAEGMASGSPDESVDAPQPDMVGIVGPDGYEWLQRGGATWYRPGNTSLDWARWLD